jgi:hypothetical protein
MLSMPSKKQTWSANIAVAQSRLNRLHDRLEIKLIDTVDLEGGPGTSFCSL